MNLQEQTNRIKEMMNLIPESKQVGKLYHFTNKEALNSILSQNKLLGGCPYLPPDCKTIIAVSTSRNKNLFYDDNVIRITLDGDKLSHHYKIKPFDYWQKEYNVPDNPQTVDEDEELILTPKGAIFNIDNYILDITEKIKIDESYMEKVGEGGEHVIYTIDDDILLKMPIKDRDDEELNPEKHFDNYIKFMQQYPEIFVDIKKLDKRRASVQKVDIEAAKEEIEYLYYLITTTPKFKNDTIKIGGIRMTIDNLYNIRTPDMQELLEKLNNFGKFNKNQLVLKWVRFIVKLQKTFKNKTLDLHTDNIGLDKEGNIKLVDW